jgi:hypothetical protein
VSVQDDTDLTEAMAEMLYDRSIAGLGRDQVPVWLGLPHEVRGHWRDIARAALAMVRMWDEVHD